MKKRRVEVGGLYRHFKGEYYRVLDVGFHTETNEPMVIYYRHGHYIDGVTYIRPYEMFISEVDHEKYPDVEQKYRFEKVEEETECLE